MKRLKTLGVAAVAVAALAAFAAGTASATVLYSGGSAMLKGSMFEATGTNSVWQMGFATMECGHSEFDGKTSNQGSATETVEGNISSLSFRECNMTVNVLTKGKLVFHHTSGANGTVTSEGKEVTIAFGSTSCAYGTPTATNIGTLSGGNPAKLVTSATLTKISGGFLCANPASWTATYTFSKPNPLEVKES
ncbi:MAG: hypothetical protein M3335_03315 [Actinomycetota bacterium]|nr:hypothetical protein [Actinomycetota bacterium]